jgi:hypothetical protein
LAEQKTRDEVGATSSGEGDRDDVWGNTRSKAPPHTSQVTETYKMPPRRYIKRRRKYGKKGPVRSIKARQAYYRRDFTEKKFFDGVISVNLSQYRDWTAIGLTDSSTGAGTNLMFAPTQGIANYNRAGNKAWISEIKARGYLSWDNATSVADIVDRVRIVCLLDTDVKGASTWDEETVFQKDLNIGNNIGSNHILDGWLNVNNAGRYKILYDKVFIRPPLTVDADSATNYQAATTRVKFKHKFIQPVMVNYKYLDADTPNAVPGDNANVIDNGIRMMYIVDGVPAAAPIGTDPLLRLTVRTGFYDHK